VSRVSAGLRLVYGVGEMAKGFEEAATNLFVLFFLHQVLGLPAWAVGVVTGASLVFDAVVDPLIGNLSDGLSHRWGRRHPWLLASAVPLGLCFAALFSPPDLGNVGVTAWIAVALFGLRASLSAFLVPHMALGAELSDDYAERTRVAGIRVFFTYLGAAVLVAVARARFFAPSEAFPDGQLNPDAYPRMGLVFGALMTGVVLLSTFGTWHVIPRLPRATPGDGGLRRFLADMREALRDRAFAVLLASLLTFFVARGTALALDLYVGTYFWGLGSDAVALPGLALAGLIVGSPLYVALAGRLDKRRMLIGAMALYALLTTLPPLLHLLGLFPTGAALKPALFGVLFVSGIVGAGGVIAGTAILADIADAHEVETGVRREGLFFGGLSFARQAATGLGTLFGGVFLSVIAFPTQATPEEVPRALVDAVAIFAGPGTALFLVGGVVLATRYRADRAAHERVLATLADRRAQAGRALSSMTPSKTVG
jgi:Na+/melibiose symporter-like transporter